MLRIGTLGVVNRAGQLTQLVRELTRSGREESWAEFKRDNSNPELIGRLVSAISNVAAVENRATGLIVWGIDDSGGKIVGTDFDPHRMKRGNEDLIPWLTQTTSPPVDLQFTEIELEGRRLVVLEIDRASLSPTQFKRVEYIRRDTQTKLLSECPQLGRKLWESLATTPYEKRVNREAESDKEVFGLLDIDAYRRLLKRPTASASDTLQYMESDGLINRHHRTGWDITNLAALCFAQRLEDFDRLERKAVRFVRYQGNDRSTAVDGYDGKKGYAVGFEGILGYIEAQLPKREVTDSIRHWEEEFPRLAVRELVANALIHQDFSMVGAGPLIELFSDRLEISNPGTPLVSDTRRLLDCPPQSRNEGLATVMRKAGICEERGSGIDKAALATEQAQLPAPDIRAVEASTVAVLLGPRTLSQMEPAERNLVTYMHSSLRWVSQQPITNSTIRERFGISDRNAARASRLIADAVEAGSIKPLDATASKRHMKYVPFWAEQLETTSI